METCEKTRRLQWRHAIVSIALLLSPSMLACGDFATTTSSRAAASGALGHLNFYDGVTGAPLGSHVSLATGARLRVALAIAPEGIQPRSTYQIQEVWLDNSIAISSFDGETILIETVEDGDVVLSVRARERDSGEVVEDQMRLSSRPLESVEVEHRCATFGENEAFYLKNHTVKIPFRAKIDGGRLTAGYIDRPFVLDSDDLAEVVDRGRAGDFWLSLGDREGSFELLSRFDQTSLALSVRDKHDINGIRMTEMPGDHGRFAAVVRLRPVIDGREICSSQIARRERSLMPELCQVSRVDTEELLRVSFTPGVFEKRCEFEVAYPDANGGEGVTRVFSLRREL